MSFYIGQKVVCVDASTPKGHPLSYLMPLKEGVTYIVDGISKCRCGNLSIDVGFAAAIPRVCVCGRKDDSSRWHFNSCRFVPLEDYEAMNELVKELTEPKLQEA